MRLILQKHAHAKPTRLMFGLSSMNLVSLGFIGRKAVDCVIQAKERSRSKEHSYYNRLTVIKQVSVNTPIFDTRTHGTQEQKPIYFFTHNLILKLINKKTRSCDAGLLRRQPITTRTSPAIYTTLEYCQLAY